MRVGEDQPHQQQVQQDRAERDKFENELKRILKASEDAGVLMRVIGSLAFQMHCPKYGYLQQAMGRAYTDIDFAAYGKQAVNPLTGEEVIAERRRIKVDYELPMRDGYTAFVLALLESASKESV